MHIHATVADKEHRAYGGHLLKGSVWMSNEIGFLRLKGVNSKRWMDKEKGVAILHVSQVTG
jgi:predicted DNA-binding protein with PD1-like motif